MDRNMLASDIRTVAIKMLKEIKEPETLLKIYKIIVAYAEREGK